ncbi:MAG: metallophosphoesterase [Pseudomonadota bacterium]
MPLKFVVMSDLHLTAGPVSPPEVDVHARLSQALDAIARNHGDADFVICAGDLADQGEPTAYAALRTAVADLHCPVHFMVGNHDARGPFLDCFGGAHADENGHIQTVIRAGGQHVILLDTLDPGEDSGALNHGRLDWLARQLAAAGSAPVILIMHHPPNPMHTSVDRIGLRDAACFRRALDGGAQIRQIIAGHVHLTSTALWHGIPCATIAGSTFSMELGVASRRDPLRRVEGPGQFAVVYSDADQTLVHFENFFDNHPHLPGEIV